MKGVVIVGGHRGGGEVREVGREGWGCSYWRIRECMCICVHACGSNALPGGANRKVDGGGRGGGGEPNLRCLVIIKVEKNSWYKPRRRRRGAIVFFIGPQEEVAAFTLGLATLVELTTCHRNDMSTQRIHTGIIHVQCSPMSDQSSSAND